MDFIAVDVETANPNFRSICQVGLVTFGNGGIIDEWQSLVSPEDYFDPMNVSIHGITETMVAGAPTMQSLAATIGGKLSGQTLVSHTAFDRVSLFRSFNRYHLSLPPVTWLDSASIARRAWPEECAKHGAGLRPLAERFGISFKHHVAVEDARVAGLIVLRAIADSGLSLADWLHRVKRPVIEIAREGNPEGPLAGSVIVFTGSLLMVRAAAAALAASAGCAVEDSVTKRTTLLVVGDQDISRLAGHEKSAKHRKAETLIQSGQSIRIVGESDFNQLLATSEAVQH